MNTAVAGVADGKTAAQIDKLIAVDDSLALRGLGTLALAAAKEDRVDADNNRSALIADLLSEAGYGGFIHHFKNYVLRGAKQYRTDAEADLSRIRTTIARYRQFGPSRGETVALDDIARTFDEYGKMLDVARNMMASGAAIEAIDARVKVDDRLALRGIDHLIRDARLEVLAQANQVDVTLSRVVKVQQAVTVLACVLLIAVALSLLWFLNRQIVAPLVGMTKSMRRIADGDYNCDIPEAEGDNELADMSRSLEILKTNSLLRLEAENQMEQAMAELEQQMGELEHMRSQAEGLAVESEELAESLAAANELAESAKAKAVAEEHQIRTIMNTVNDAIITADADGKIETFNLAAHRMFGYSPEEVVGRNVSFLMPESLRSANDIFIKSLSVGNPSRRAGETVEQTALRKDGTEFPIDVCVNSMHLGDEIHLISVIRDITERKAREAEIERLALTDSLTGLANRHAFETRFEEAMASARRRKTHLAVMLIDLDKFKQVNDQFGHPVGDALLIKVSDCLREICRSTDILARLGGDEFAAVLTDLEDPKNAYVPAEKIVDTLSKPMMVLGHTVQIGASIGIAFFNDHADDRENLMTLADRALYEAKNQGRDTFRIYRTPAPAKLTA